MRAGYQGRGQRGQRRGLIGERGRASVNGIDRQRKVGDGTDKGSGVGKEVGDKPVERSREG
jgi:hypothetical protein